MRRQIDFVHASFRNAGIIGFERWRLRCGVEHLETQTVQVEAAPMLWKKWDRRWFGGRLRLGRRLWCGRLALVVESVSECISLIRGEKRAGLCMRPNR